jgi:hypothetical protein
MYLALLFSMKSCPNYVKISFQTSYYMSMRSVRYFSVNTENSETEFPKYHFLEGTDRYLFSFLKETIPIF